VAHTAGECTYGSESNNVINEGDWVLICETGERGKVIDSKDRGERFLVEVPPTDKWKYTKRVHVMVEKIRKVNPPKIKKVVIQLKLFIQEEV
jgi:hypothetical protein